MAAMSRPLKKRWCEDQKRAPRMSRPLELWRGRQPSTLNSSVQNCVARSYSTLHGEGRGEGGGGGGKQGWVRPADGSVQGGVQGGVQSGVQGSMAQSRSEVAPPHRGTHRCASWLQHALGVHLPASVSPAFLPLLPEVMQPMGNPSCTHLKAGSMSSTSSLNSASR